MKEYYTSSMFTHFSTLTPTPSVDLITDMQIQVLSYVLCAGSLLSIVGSGSIIIIAIKKKKVCNENVLPLFHLCVADLFGCIISVIGILGQHVVGDDMNRSLCVFITLIATSCYMSSFLLTANYALQVYKQVADNLGIVNNFAGLQFQMSSRFPCRVSSSNQFVYTVSWVFPAVISMLVMFVESGVVKGSYVLNADFCSCCFPMFIYESSECQTYLHIAKSEFNWYNFYKYFFTLVLLFSLVATIVIYCMTLKNLEKLIQSGGVIGHSQHVSLSNARKRTGYFMAVFILSWLATLLLSFISFKKNFSMKTFFPLYIIQACTSPLQGFLNSMVYGWRRSNFRNELKSELHSATENEPINETDEEYSYE